MRVRDMMAAVAVAMIGSLGESKHAGGRVPSPKLFGTRQRNRGKRLSRAEYAMLADHAERLRRSPGSQAMHAARRDCARRGVAYDQFTIGAQLVKARMGDAGFGGDSL